MISNYTSSPKPISDFGKSNLSGWQKNRLIIADNPNLIESGLLCEVRVKHNWPSYKSHIYTSGYIEFSNYMRFDRNHQTIAGAKRYLFFYEAACIYLEMALAKRVVVTELDHLSDRDFFAVAELLIQQITPSYRLPSYRLRNYRMFRPSSERDVIRNLTGLGLSQLRDLADMLSANESASSTMIGKAA